MPLGPVFKHRPRDLASVNAMKQTCVIVILAEDLRLSGSMIRKSRFIFTKERRIIRQKSGCLSHSNERIFQVHIQMQWRIKDPGNGFHMHIRCWFRFVDFIIYLKCSMKMK